MTDYGADLAYVHDAGFLDLAREASPLIARLLRERGVSGGRVVELGCGSGETAAALADAGHEVLGIDSSRAMIELARSRGSGAHFRLASWTDAELPRCDAVLAIGEVLGYTGVAKGTKAELRSLFARVAGALVPGGLFVFDLATPGRVPTGTASGYRLGEDWAILHSATEDPGAPRLVRRVTTFRRVEGGAYRRSEEVHRLRLWEPDEVTEMLREARFRVQMRRGYGAKALAPGHRVFVARRP